MITRICLYATVYNNAEYVEASIKSVWRPDAEIVIVDSYSTDGTWEKLLELRKDFNLRIYRYKCSRGLGRNIALHKCSPGAVAAYFDLDTVYNEAYHRVINYAAETRRRVFLGNVYVAERDYIIRRGGWRDLLYGEDVELVSRIGFDAYIPVSAGRNAEISPRLSAREKRYGGLSRIIRSSVDLVRGNGISIRRILINRSKRAVVAYAPALLIGIYRNREPDNPTWIEKTALVRMIPPREAGISEKYFYYIATLTLIRSLERGEKAIDKKILGAVSRPVYKLHLRSREFRIIYFKDLEAVDRDLLSIAERLEKIAT